MFISKDTLYNILLALNVCITCIGVVMVMAMVVGIIDSLVNRKEKKGSDKDGQQ